MLIDISSENKAFIIIFIISPSEQIRRFYVVEVGAKPFSQMGNRKVCIFR